MGSIFSGTLYILIPYHSNNNYLIITILFPYNNKTIKALFYLEYSGINLFSVGENKKIYVS